MWVKFKITFWNGEVSTFESSDRTFTVTDEDIEKSVSFRNVHLIRRVFIEKVHMADTIEFNDLEAIEVFEFGEVDHVFNSLILSHIGEYTILNIPKNINHLTCSPYTSIEGLDELLEHNPDLDISMETF